MHKASSRHNHNSDYDLYEDLEKIKSALREATLDVKGRANEMLTKSYEDAEEETLALKKNLSDYIEEKPFKSIGIAVLAGVCLGFLFRK